MLSEGLPFYCCACWMFWLLVWCFAAPMQAHVPRGQHHSRRDKRRGTLGWKFQARGEGTATESLYPIIAELGSREHGFVLYLVGNASTR